MKLVDPLEIIDLGDAFLYEEDEEWEALWWPWPLPQGRCLYSLES